MDSVSFVEGYKVGLGVCIKVLESPEQLTVEETLSALRLALEVVGKI